MKLRLGVPLGFALALTGPAAAHAVIDLVGRDHATFSGTPAAGPVVGYSVYVSRNGQPEARHGFAADSTRETVYGAYGDTVVVRVAAADSAGNEGPLSPHSDTVRFVAPPPPAPLPPVAPGPAPRDFDGDGVSDIWLPEPDTGRAYLWSVGAEGFGQLGELPKLPASWSIVATPDTDGDGSSDVLWRDAETGRLDLWLIRGGSLVGGDMVRGPEGPDWELATAGDFDGDGRDDLLLWHPSSGELEVWLMEGTEVTDTVPWSGGPTAGWSAAGGGDYDGDGLHDALWHHSSQGRLEAWLVRSPEQVERAVFDDALDPGWSVEGSGDADGDGDDDVLLRHRALGRLEARTLAGGVIAFPSPASGDEIVALGDYDGDGRLDLLWRLDSEGLDSEGYRVALSSGGNWDLADPWLAGDGGAGGSCEGDLDNDGRVGVSDFITLRRCYGEPAISKCSRADLNGDGVVGISDFNLFRARFGTSCGGS